MTEQLNEARQVHASTHKLIETLGGGGIPERVCVVAMQQALLERLVASGGVDGARRWLQDQADGHSDWGPAFLDAARKH